RAQTRERELKGERLPVRCELGAKRTGSSCQDRRHFLKAAQLGLERLGAPPQDQLWPNPRCGQQRRGRKAHGDAPGKEHPHKGHAAPLPTWAWQPATPGAAGGCLSRRLALHAYDMLTGTMPSVAGKVADLKRKRGSR